MKHIRKVLALTILLVLGFGISIATGQGPVAGQIQAALRAFLLLPHTWTAVQTFSGGTSVSGQILLPDGTAAAPSLAFTNDTAMGLRRTTAATVYFSNNASAVILGVGSINGTASLQLRAGGTSPGILLASTSGVYWTGGHEQNAVDTSFVRTSSGVVSMVSTGTTNGIRIPNGSNAEYCTGGAWSSNVCEVGVTVNGGTNRNARIRAIGGTIAFQGTADNATLNTTLGVWNKLNATTLTGMGTPLIVASGRVTAQSAANASISTFTVGAADGTFEVSANMNVTASVTLATTLTCTYTDESNTARTMIFPVQQVSGTFVAAGAITGTGAWETPVMHIRAKAATAITILTSTGTFTTVTYTAEGIIKQIS